MNIFDFSGHATRDDLLNYILRVKPSKAILVHGDIAATEWFAQQLKDKLPECETIIPKPGNKYYL
jgi:predicted metal-dependent RNase